MTKSSMSWWFFLLIFLFNGCASAPKERIAIEPAQEAGPQPTAIRVDTIDGKIESLETLLREKRIRPEDESLAVIIIKAYQSAKPCLDDRSRTPCDGVNHDLLQGLGLIDERYFSLSGNTLEPLNAQADNQGEREAIIAAYADKDYRGVIQRCTELTERSGADALGSELQTLFALSLGAQHRYADAVRAAEKALAGHAGLLDPVELRLKSAEWHLALGQRSEAAALLNSVEQSITTTSLERKELEQRMAALTPGSAPTPPVASRDGQGQGPPNPPETLEAVEKLVKEGRFDDARALLENNRESIQNRSQTGTYEQALDRLEKGEAQYLRQQIAVISMKGQTLSRAKQLVEAERFEEAIAAIDALDAEGTANDETRALQAEAMSGIVNRERNRAAKAFYSAKQTEDPVRKEAYLRSSHDILEQLLNKYPSSPFIQKIKSNLDTVNSEMAKVGLKP